jgi:hypothetical protein
MHKGKQSAISSTAACGERRTRFVLYVFKMRLSGSADKRYFQHRCGKKGDEINSECLSG